MLNNEREELQLQIASLYHQLRIEAHREGLLWEGLQKILDNKCPAMQLKDHGAEAIHCCLSAKLIAHETLESARHA